MVGGQGGRSGGCVLTILRGSGQLAGLFTHLGGWRMSRFREGGGARLGDTASPAPVRILHPPTSLHLPLQPSRRPVSFLLALTLTQTMTYSELSLPGEPHVLGRV